jgi:aminoglycoside phosphotransferase (APT) family kinase protein
MPPIDHAVSAEPFVADLAARVERRARLWRPSSAMTDFTPLTGGSSSLTYLARLRTGDKTDKIVVKVAPPGLEPVRNRDVLRQATVMSALGDADGVRVPQVYFSETGQGLDRPPFVAMEFVVGECTEPLLEEGTRVTSPADTHARFLDAARMLGSLHRADATVLDLGDERPLTIEDEIARWERAFGTVPADLAGAYVEGARVLRAAAPAPMTVAVTHGDYRLGNTLCVHGSVTSIIDWEIWALGDPRTDLTWLTYFTDEARHPAAPPTGPSGSPTVDEVVAEYEAAFGEQIPDLDYFHALTRYKEAAATALLIKRARRTGDMPEAFSRMEPLIVPMIDDVIDALR